jgi:hypothetical protein
MTAQSREWDSSAYHCISTPQESWGKNVLAQLSLRGAGLWTESSALPHFTGSATTMRYSPAFTMPCAQCGGEKNLARLLYRVHELTAGASYAPFFAGFESAWEYAAPEVTAERLRRARFDDIETSLEPAPVYSSSGAEYREFISKVIL